MKGGAHPSPFAALSSLIRKRVFIYCWVDRESFPVAAWRSRNSNSRDTATFCAIAGSLVILSPVIMSVLKTLLLQCLSESEFYGDLVYKFRKIIGKYDFSYYFKKIIVRYKKIGYNIDVLRQTACLVVIKSRLTTLLTSLITRR